MPVLHALKKTLCHRAALIAILLVCFLITAPWTPVVVHQLFFTVSLAIKDLMLWLLPLTVGSFIAFTLISFDKKAPLFIGILILFEATSNFSSVWFSYLSASSVSDILPMFRAAEQNISFQALYRLPFTKPSFWSADKGTLLGLVIGFLALLPKFSVLKNLVGVWKTASNWLLTKVFSPLIPLFILGFFSKMYHSGLFEKALGQYSYVVIWLCVFLSLYISALMFFASDLTFKGFLKTSKNLLPAGGIAFSSGCSLSTMPWTIEGAARNLKTPQLAQAIIPATTNIQQIGDCIANTFLCFLIFQHFNGYAPPLSMWLPFSLMFTLARFTTAAVLGGAILIMIPVYEAYLGFNAEMVALILAFNVLLDPIITSSNVLSNGALCSVFEKVWIKILKFKENSL